MGQVTVQTLTPISRYGPSLSGRSQSVTKPMFLCETQAAFLHPSPPSRESRLPKIKQSDTRYFAGQECPLSSLGGPGFSCLLFLLPDYCHSASFGILNMAQHPSERAGSTSRPRQTFLLLALVVR